jgi:LPXTG-motif cell wall-anchored protein
VVHPVDEEAQMIWWILLAVVVLLALGLVLRRRKGSGRTAVAQRDVDRLRRDQQAKGFGSM